MTRICAYILLIALTVQSLYRSMMTVEYRLHLSEYISDCINKDKPLLHCDGQCVLMKKVAEKEKNEARKNLIVIDYNVHYVLKKRAEFTLIPPAREIATKLFSPYLVHYSFAYEAPLFRPPIA